MRSLSLLIVTLALLAGCGKEGPRNRAEYFQWVNDPAHGLIKQHAVNGVALSMKYLPPSYLVSQSLAGMPDGTAARRDSLMREYRNTLCFLLTVGMSDSNSGDIMTRGIGSYDEFSQRAAKMNFEMQNYVSLRSHGKEYRPVLATMENTYGMVPKRNIMLVFAQDAGLRSGDTLDVVFNDMIFETGISHYLFLRKDFAPVDDIAL